MSLFFMSLSTFKSLHDLSFMVTVYFKKLFFGDVKQLQLSVIFAKERLL